MSGDNAPLELIKGAVLAAESYEADIVMVGDENVISDVCVKNEIKLPENIKLMIIGSPNFKDAIDSPFLTEIKQMAEQYKNKIVFTGFIDNRQVYKYYKLAEMQAIPSIWNDAAPLVVFEGVLCGLPQLVTKSGGIPEYVCKEGSIIIPRDHDLVENLVKNIEKLSKDKKLLKAMSDNNKEFSKRYCKTNYYKDFVKIMEEKLKTR